MVEFYPKLMKPAFKREKRNGIVMPEFNAVLEGRRSIREFRVEPVPIKLVEKAIQASTFAPSAHNAQPWRFIILQESSVKRRLAEAMGIAFQRDLEQDGALQVNIEKKVGDSVERFSKAPILVLVCLTMESMDSYPDSERQLVEQVMGIQSVAAVIQNLLLAIHANGLGACWYCAPLFCPDVVRKTLKLSSELQPQALVTIGYPAETPKMPNRLPVDAITSFIDEYNEET